MDFKLQKFLPGGIKKEALVDANAWHSYLLFLFSKQRLLMSYNKVFRAYSQYTEFDSRKEKHRQLIN